jgi:hypothetical protein
MLTDIAAAAGISNGWEGVLRERGRAGLYGVFTPRRAHSHRGLMRFCASVAPMLREM